MEIKHLSQAGSAFLKRMEGAQRTIDAADLAAAEHAVLSAVTAPITASQFDALVSLAFSIGPSAFAASDVVRRLNAGATLAAADAFDVWRRVGGAAHAGLVRRRAEEKALFLSQVAAPMASAELKIEADYAYAAASAPTKAAAVAAAPPARQSDSAPPAPRADDDSDAARLRRILAAEPQTAHALLPPPRPLRPMIEPAALMTFEPANAPAPMMHASQGLLHAAPLRLASARNAAVARRTGLDHDSLVLGALAAFGGALVALSALTYSASDGASLGLFAAPGMIALSMASWHLFKRAPRLG